MSWPKPAPIEPIEDSATASAGPLDQIARNILARYKPVEQSVEPPVEVEPPAAIAASRPAVQAAPVSKPVAAVAATSPAPQAAKVAARQAKKAAPKSKKRSAASRTKTKRAASAKAVKTVKTGKSASTSSALITPAAVTAATEAARKRQKRRSVSGPEALAAMKRLWERMNAPIELSRPEAPTAPVPVASTPRPESRLVAPTRQEPDPVEALKNFIPDLRLFPIKDAPRKRDREADEQDVFNLIENDFDPR